MASELVIIYDLRLNFYKLNISSIELVNTEPIFHITCNNVKKSMQWWAKIYSYYHLQESLSSVTQVVGGSIIIIVSQIISVTCYLHDNNTVDSFLTTDFFLQLLALLQDNVQYCNKLCNIARTISTVLLSQLFAHS